jgi:hypothetical protein
MASGTGSWRHGRRARRHPGGAPGRARPGPWPSPASRWGPRPQGLGRVLDPEPGEEAALHDTGLPGLPASRRVRASSRDSMTSRYASSTWRSPSTPSSTSTGRRRALPAALQPLPVPGVVAEDVAHGPPCEPQEVVPALDGAAPGAIELDPRLVDEGGGVQGEIAVPPPPLPAGEGPELLVHQGEEGVEARRAIREGVSPWGSGASSMIRFGAGRREGRKRPVPGTVQADTRFPICKEQPR